MSHEAGNESANPEELPPVLLNFIESVCDKAPPDDVALSIRQEFEALSREERTDMVNRIVQHNGETCSLLFLVVKKGDHQTLRYLIQQTDADLELRGKFFVQVEHVWHDVPPLWCAAVMNHLEACRVLVEAGADIDGPSDSGSTPMRSACYFTNSDIVSFLVEQGGDVNRVNQFGGTCLINSVQSPALSEFLLRHGARINSRDMHQKTALHHSIEENHFETIKVLLRHNPNYLAQNMYGDDALQSACLRDEERIVQYLIDNCYYPAERVASAYELLGASFFFSHVYEKTTEYWLKAVRHRTESNIKKDTSFPLASAYMDMVPFETQEDVCGLVDQMDLLELHSLMVFERVLGSGHKETIRRVMSRAYRVHHTDTRPGSNELCKHLLDMELENDTLLHSDAVGTFDFLTISLFRRCLESETEPNLDLQSNFNDLMFLLDRLNQNIRGAIEQLNTEPVFQSHTMLWHRVREKIVLLLYMVGVVPNNMSEEFELMQQVKLLLSIAPTISEGNTLLHLTAATTFYINTAERPRIRPEITAVRVLLKAGAPIEATNNTGCTALHIASQKMRFQREIVQMLLDAGAHVDRPNDDGELAYRMLSEIQNPGVNAMKSISLKCLCATKVKSLGVDYEKRLPEALARFVGMH